MNQRSKFGMKISQVTAFLGHFIRENFTVFCKVMRSILSKFHDIANCKSFQTLVQVMKCIQMEKGGDSYCLLFDIIVSLK